MSNVQLAVQLFLQLAVILVSCRLVGMIAVRLGQPQVVAEMVTGVLLGPSLLGWLAPGWQAWIFPWDRTQATRDTQSYLFPAAQLGLALYMFTVGLEFRTDIIRKHLRCSIAVSAAGILTPLALGGALGWFLHRHTELFPPATRLPEAALFLGASMCITAFPVLARIIQQKGLGGTTMGTVAIGAGAINDAIAWCLLAVVLSSIDGDFAHAARNIGGGVTYSVAVLTLVRPLLARLEGRLTRDGNLTEGGLVACLSLMALGSWFTELIGLHAVFGAFVMGAAIPRGAVTAGIVERTGPLTTVLLLPLFFAYSGLNTKIGLLDSGQLWLICLAVLAVAVAGKGAACCLAARCTGVSTREALGIGTLMNARGLMELIIIDIGLERGVITERLFATLVIMAVVTTLMTSPLFDLLAGRRPEPAA